MSQPAFPGGLSHSDPDLSDRQREVFRALLGVHARTAQPVGSEALSAAAGAGSPASVRVVLAELEELGLLERAHCSSGRVPTARGWAFHVRAQLVPVALPPAVLREVDQVLSRSTHDVERLLNEASRLLSSLTRQLGLALAASLDDTPLRDVDLAALGERRTLMVLDLGATAARTLVLELESPLDPDQLPEVRAVLRERLVGRTLEQVRERLATDATLARHSAARIVARAAAAGWSEPVRTPLFATGAMWFAELPEFASSARLAPVLRSVESGSPLDRLMVASVEGQTAVRVGVDEAPALARMSLVSFALPGSVRGAVGVLGPLRMDYAYTLAVVDAVGARLAELL
jgi:heat-inducible transcriptional repressor